MNLYFRTTSLPTTVPLRYDTIYYVESTDNEELNSEMRQLQQAGPLFRNTEMMPVPIKLQYVSQKELDRDYLRAQLSGTFDAEEVNDVVENMRECLSADKGGSLTARCVPSFTRDNVMEYDNTICFYPYFDSISAENALEKAKSFARYLAEMNFERLMRKSYRDYQREREYYDDLPTPSPSGFGFMSFQVNLPEPRSVTRIMKKGFMELDEIFGQIAEINGITPAELAATYLNEKQKKGKLKEVCPIYIKNGDIYLKISKKESKKVEFDRRNVAKTIYIFYLQKIELLWYNTKLPLYVSKVELEKYKKVLLSIYWDVSGNASKNEKDIMSWWDKEANTFTRSVSSINKFFNKEFDIEALQNNYRKSYLLEIKDKDSYGNSRYGISLSIKDIDLGSYSVRTERYQELYEEIK